MKRRIPCCSTNLPRKSLPSSSPAAISREPMHIQNMYGLNDPRPTGFEKTDDFLNIPRQALVARRLIEVGVPFIEKGAADGIPTPAK